MIKFIEDSGMDETEEIQKSVKDLHASKSQRHNFDPTTARTQDISSIVEARKLRLHKENEVRKLHNRIAVLQEEEEKALKRIENTR